MWIISWQFHLIRCGCVNWSISYYGSLTANCIRYFWDHWFSLCYSCGCQYVWIPWASVSSMTAWYTAWHTGCVVVFKHHSVCPSVCVCLSVMLDVVVVQAALKLKQKMFKEDWAFFKAQRRLLEQALPKHRQPASNCHSGYFMLFLLEVCCVVCHRSVT